MTSRTDSTAELATMSAPALSLLYVDETSHFLTRIKRLITASLIAAAIVIAASTLEVAGVVVLSEPVELATASVSLFIIIPAAAYYTIRATQNMNQWRARLAELSFGLRFASQEATGESSNLKFANQALRTLETYSRPGTSAAGPAYYTDYKLGEERYDVVIPSSVTKELGGFKGALVMKRIAGESISVHQLLEVIQKAKTSGMGIWRLMVVSDRDFPVETVEYHASMREPAGFHVDLVEEKPTGFSIMSLGE